MGDTIVREGGENGSEGSPENWLFDLSWEERVEVSLMDKGEKGILGRARVVV